MWFLDRSVAINKIILEEASDFLLYLTCWLMLRKNEGVRYTSDTQSFFYTGGETQNDFSNFAKKQKIYQSIVCMKIFAKNETSLLTTHKEKYVVRSETNFCRL